MKNVHFAKRTTLQLFLAAILTLIWVPAENASAAGSPCLAQFADSAWLQGQPQEVPALLNKNLLLSRIQVVPSSNFDFGGVIPVEVFQGYKVTLGATLPSSPKILLDDNSQNWFWSWTQAKNYLTHTYEFNRIGYKSEIKPFQYFDVRIGAEARKAPITVTFLYQGADCLDRIVSVPSYIDIVPIKTMNVGQATDEQITEFLKRNNSEDADFLNIRNQLSRVRNIEAWFKYTKKEPIPIIFPKDAPKGPSVDLYKTKYAWRSHPGVSTLLWLAPYTDFNTFSYIDSTDGCLTNKNKDKYVKVINSEEPYFASKKNICRVFLHIFSSDFGQYDRNIFEPEQMVVEGWITKAVIPSKNQLYLQSIFCSDGKNFKVIKAKTPSCPPGLKIITK